MVKCSIWHVIPQAVPVNLTHQQAHDLDLGLKLGTKLVLTCWRLGNQPHPIKERGGRSPLGGSAANPFLKNPIRFRRSGEKGAPSPAIRASLEVGVGRRLSTTR
jgi:hypothetical protein